MRGIDVVIGERLSHVLVDNCFLGIENRVFRRKHIVAEIKERDVMLLVLGIFGALLFVVSLKNLFGLFFRNILEVLLLFEMHELLDRH